LLHEAGFNSDWTERCRAHEQNGVRAVYNEAEYSELLRAMLQTWADKLDRWIGDGGWGMGCSLWVRSPASRYPRRGGGKESA
jgi:hypothetical protein